MTQVQKFDRRYGVQRFARNTEGRDLIVGDIHGCFARLAQTLMLAGFDFARDRLFCVGDLVDRGPESPGALVWLGLPWFHSVRGNHDDMAMRWPNGRMDPANYARNGGAWMMEAPQDLQQAVAAAMERLPIAIELETAYGLVGIVHADCPGDDWQAFITALRDPAMPNARRDAFAQAAMWLRDRVDHGIDTPVAGLRALVVGHTPADHVRVLGNVHHIDTFGWRQQGHFTLLDAATLTEVHPVHL